MPDNDATAALRAARDRAEQALRQAQDEVAHLRESLMRSDDKLREFSLEVSGVRSQLISTGYLQSSTGDVSEALSRALSDGTAVRETRYRGEYTLPRPTPDLHRVTPILGEPGLLLRTDTLTLVDERDGRTALAVIDRGTLQEPTIWRVKSPGGCGLGGKVERCVSGWAEAMTAAVELALHVRTYLAAAGRSNAAAQQLHEWSRESDLARTPSTR